MDQTPCTIFRACFAQKLGLDAVWFGTWPQMDRGHFDTHLLVLVICRGEAPPSCCARPFCRLKAPLGLSLLRFASQTRTTLFLLCTKSCIVWRKIGIWCSFRWKFTKRKSLKLLVPSRSFRLFLLKLEIYCSIGFIVGILSGTGLQRFVMLHNRVFTCVPGIHNPS